MTTEKKDLHEKLYKPFVSVADDVLSNMVQTDDETFIIGAGFARTGTSSLQIALAKLGYRCYHMRELFKKENESDTYVWFEVGKMKYNLKKEKNIKSFKLGEWDKITVDYDWNKLFNKKDKKYNGTVDFPGASFYFDLMKYYKNDYKVILTVRDNSKQWYNSISSTIIPMVIIGNRSWFFRILNWMDPKPMNEVGDYCFWKLLFDGKYTNEEYSRNKYDEWIESVKKHVPKDKLLIFNVKQGWKPLCKFLNKDIPFNEEFPRANDSANMKSILKTIQIVEIVSNVVAIAVIGIASYFMYKKFKK